MWHSVRDYLRGKRKVFLVSCSFFGPTIYISPSFSWFTWCLQDVSSFRFSIHMMFPGSWQSLAVSYFPFTWYLQDLGSLPSSIYMIFTGSWQSPFFNLHDIYKILADLHDIYRILAVSLFQFTWCLQDLVSLPFSIYMLFTGSWQSPFFNLHDVYRILAVLLFLIYMMFTRC